eukprot:Lithocolla_globosa_v1_NODE_4553_length_1411_cov_4.857670.p2 type:complete len:105 gc:universal NODE_4553_length_1411_cov_4.857670:1194-880(-)
MIGQVLSPKLVNKPSAIVFGSTDRTKLLLSKERLQSSAPLGSAAIILIFGFRALAAIQQPDNIPPPPTGIIKVSSPELVSSRTCSHNSSIMVPCPAIIFGLSKG